MRLVLSTVAAAAAVLPVAAVAASTTFTAWNGLRARMTGPETFIVLYRGAPGDSDFWCAAGEFVVHGLRLPSNTRIYRLSPPPRRAGQGIEFTFDSSKAQPSGISRFGNTDEGYSAAAARGLCDGRVFPRVF